MKSHSYFKPVACFLLSLATCAIAQNQNASVIQARVDEIIRSTLLEDELWVNGVRTVPMAAIPSKDSIAEIQSFGEAAIPALTKHLEKETRVNSNWQFA